MLRRASITASRASVYLLENATHLYTLRRVPRMLHHAAVLHVAVHRHLVTLVHVQATRLQDAALEARVEEQHRPARIIVHGDGLSPHLNAHAPPRQELHADLGGHGFQRPARGGRDAGQDAEGEQQVVARGLDDLGHPGQQRGLRHEAAVAYSHHEGALVLGVGKLPHPAEVWRRPRRGALARGGRGDPRRAPHRRCAQEDQDGQHGALARTRCGARPMEASLRE
mmetsp:Transcript_52422/g.136518  ORF Transcript_52422/g.136518 Transcript_52422/m.136518 type:complete len:225 (+) Transcript_52422:414-1088(+)